MSTGNRTQGSTSRLIPLDGLEKVPILLNIHYDGWNVWRNGLLEFLRKHPNAIEQLQGKAGSTYKEALDTELAMIVLLTAVGSIGFGESLGAREVVGLILAIASLYLLIRFA